MKKRKLQDISLFKVSFLSLHVQPEFPMEKPTIFGYVDAEDNEPVEFWINKASMDNFHLSMPKCWDLLIRADRVKWRQYILTAPLDPENILENKSIPLFVFEYFSQKDISGLIDET